MGYSPWGHKESDMTERLTLTLCTHRAASLCCTVDTEHCKATINEIKYLAQEKKKKSTTAVSLVFCSVPRLPKVFKSWERLTSYNNGVRSSKVYFLP